MYQWLLRYITHPVVHSFRRHNSIIARAINRSLNSILTSCRPFCSYIMLDLCSISFQDVTSVPSPISVQVPANISIYGITLIVKRELGPCTLNIKIYQSKEREQKQEMTSSMKLKDFGFLGTLPPDEPEKLTLFFDYDYPLMDCPLLMANFSI